MNNNTDSNKVQVVVTLPDSILDPWKSEEYKRLFGVTESEKEVEVTINNLLDVLEEGLVGNFSKVVLGFDKCSTISEHAGTWI